jgi:hypothetical protein
MSFLTDLATHIKSWANNKFSLSGHDHNTAYEPKNVNIQSHVTAVGNPHGTTKADIGLGNVTNNAQVKKSASSTNGNIPVWDGVTGDALGSGFGIETILAGSESKIPTASAVKTALDNIAAGITQSGMLPGVQNIIALKAINTTVAGDYPDTIMVLVEETGLYRLDRQSSATNDDNLVIAPTTGVGRWLKISPNLTDHNLMAGKQGGTTNEYYHVTSAVYAALAGSHGTPSGSNKYITQTDTIFTNIETDGDILVAGVVVSSAEWTAFDNALAS